MKSLVKSVLAAGAAVAMMAVAITPASADNWHHGYNNWHHGWGGGGWHNGYYGGWGGGGWGYGAAGLGAGLIIGSAIAQPGYYGPGYYGGYGYAPPPRYYYGAPRRYYVNDGGLRPWTAAWSRYCFSRYRTFDGHSGTFVGNDGARHFCVAS